MDIAINARVLNERQGGPSRYMLNIIRELSKIDKENIYHILLYDNIDFSFPLPNNFKLKIIKIKSKIFFDYIYLPIFSYFNKIDIFLFPKNTFSPMIRGKKIPVYHDIVYFEKFKFREFKFFDNLHHRLMIPVAAKFSRVDLTVSDFTASRMMELLKINRDKIRIVKEGVEEHFTKIKDQSVLNDTIKKFNLQLPFFFYSGSLSPRKNMLNLIKAFIQIKDEFDHVLYFTGGYSWRDSDVHSLITKYGLEDRIVKLGFLSEKELVNMYNLAECYLYPSLYEGFGLPILEAQACGCPVITSKAASCPEVAGDGAILVDPYNIDDIALAMKKNCNKQ